jgi:integrase/recombinase XerD
MTLELSEIVAEFARRRTTASSYGAESTGDRYRREILPPGDYEREVKAWVPWLQDEGKSVWEADRGDVRRYLRELRRAGYADSTIETRLSAVSLFYSEAGKMIEEGGYRLPENMVARYDSVDEIQTANPANGIELDDFGISGRSSTEQSSGLQGREEIPYLTPDQFIKLENHVPSPETQNKLICRILYNTGMRRQELVELKVGDIDRGKQTIDVPAVKSESGRIVPYDDWLTGLFTEWLDRGLRDAVSGPSDSTYLFPSSRGDTNHISGIYLNSVVKEAAENAGIQSSVAEYVDGREMSSVTAHTLRHSYGVQAIRSDIDVRSLQKLMGHNDISTTERYLQLADEDLLDRARRFNPGI